MPQAAPVAQKKPRILVVEDEVIVARDIQQQLQDLGYDLVGHATRGEQAITLTGELLPDLVLMDIRLAGNMDGIAAAQAIRLQHSLPIVFLTAFAEDDVLARAKLADPYGYILKPFSARELRTVVEMALYKHQAEEKLRLAQIELQSQNEDLRRTQAQLESTRARYVDLYDHAPMGYFTLSETGLILEANLTAATLLGEDRADLIKRPFSRFVFKDDVNICYFLYKQLIMHREPQSRELRMQQHDGTHFFAHLVVNVLQSASGTTVLRLVLSDITERKQSEAETLATKLQLQAVLKGIPIPVVVKDEKGHFVMLNAACEQQFGLRYDDLGGTDGSQHLPPEQIAHAMTSDKNVFARGQAIDVEESIWSAKHKENRLCHVFKNPVFDAAGKPLYLISAMIDLTDRKHRTDN